MAYYLKASGVLEGDVEECLDLYFRMCSVSVTALDIANLSAVLANQGKCPFSKEMLIEPHSAKAIRALMLTCGMYDGSGEFAMSVGFPGKERRRRRNRGSACGKNGNRGVWSVSG